MKLSSLVAVLRIVQQVNPIDVEITGVTADSRRVQPGTLFVAVPGLNADGHEYIAQAVQRGAVAVVGERPPELLPVLGTLPPLPYFQAENSRAALAWLAAAWNDFPARDLTVIGVTGTDGKTTTCSLITAILRAAGRAVGTVTTVSADIDGETLDTGLHVTTPDAPEMQRFLGRMAVAGCEFAVIEATSHGLHQRRVDACEFDIAAVTNITHEHLDYHGSWENYAAAKSRLFRELTYAADKPGVAKIAVLNADDASFPMLTAVLNQGRADVLRLTYGLQSGMVQANRIEHAPDHTSFVLDLGPGVREFGLPPDLRQTRMQTSLIGNFNVYNTLAAACVTLALGVTPDTVQKAVANFPGVLGRMERIDEGQPFLAVVDFAHSPVSLARALETVRPLVAPDGRLITVFGSAGERDRAKRYLMGAVGAQLADVTIITAEDPRTESLAEISAEIGRGCREAGGVEGESFWRVDDRAEAIALACRMARAGDVVIACGKGHERSMCFGTTETPWNEQEAMRAGLRAL